MARARYFLILLIAALGVSPPAFAQTSVALTGRSIRGTVSANGGSVTLRLPVGDTMGSAKVQTLDSYSGTLKIQCSLDGTVFDSTNTASATLLGATSGSTSITDTVGVYSIADVAGCRALKVIATAGFAASDTTLVITSLPSGGSSSGSSGSSFNGVLLDAAAGDPLTDTVNNALKVNIVAGAVGGSGGTSVAEDAASADADLGTPAYTVRNNTLTGATTANGDYQPQKSTAAGALYIAPTFGDTVSDVNNGAVSAATQRVTIANNSTGILAQVTLVPTVTTVGTITNPVTVTDGAGALNVIIDSATLGTVTTVEGAGALLTSSQLIDDIVFAEDVGHTTADKGVMSLTVRKATTPTDRSAGATDGDYEPLQTDGNGRLYVNAAIYDAAGAAVTFGGDQTLDAGITTTGPLQVCRGSTATPSAMSADNDATAVRCDLNGSVSIVGKVAHDAAYAGNPVGVGYYASTAPPSDVSTTGDMVRGWARMSGAQVVEMNDPCSGPKNYIPFTQTTNTRWSTGTSSTRTFICHIDFVVGAAENVAIVSGTGSICGTSVGPLMGGTTAATGYILLASEGMVAGTGGASIAKTDTDADDICILQSGAVRISGTLVTATAVSQ